MSKQRWGWAVLALVALAVLAGKASANEADAIAALKKLGAKIKQNNKLRGRPVVEVDLSKTRVKDVGLEELAAFPQLQRLDLGATLITDAGLKELASLKNLLAVRAELPAAVKRCTLTLGGERLPRRAQTGRVGRVERRRRRCDRSPGRAGSSEALQQWGRPRRAPNIWRPSRKGSSGSRPRSASSGRP
jgi:hypothetical protein